MDSEAAGREPAGRVVQILHFEGCSNLERAREAVKHGLAMAGLSEPVRVEEIVGEFASPTVTVDGRDVTGHGADGPCACRLDLPTAAQVAAALVGSIG